MVSDLTSPICIGAEPRYEVMKNGHNAGSLPAEKGLEYQWRVVSGSGQLIHEAKTKERFIRIAAKELGTRKISVTVLKNGMPMGEPMEMVQEVREQLEEQENNEGFAFTNPNSTWSELINNFKGYILDAAAATGPNGVPARFLASVLLNEIDNRPTPDRDLEILNVEEPIRDMVHGTMQMPWEIDNRSIGVGQVRMSTAAMLEGHTPWVDQNRGHRIIGSSMSDINYHMLEGGVKAELFEMLRWPKTNIQLAAKLLAKLKNRDHRYPEMTKAEFGANERAKGVVATEYNSGGTDTPRDLAYPSEYGNWVNEQMSYGYLKRHFPNE